jgi:hypothetical protein
LKFTPLDADVFEQEHFSAGTLMLTVDYEMFVPMSLQPNEVGVLHLKRSKQETTQSIVELSSDYQLDIEGFTPEGEAVFTYKNVKQNLTQRFAVGLKQYHAHLQVRAMDEKFKEIPEDELTHRVRLLHDASDGAYIFSPEIDDDGFQHAYEYSTLDPNVQMQQGKSLQ